MEVTFLLRLLYCQICASMKIKAVNEFGQEKTESLSETLTNLSIFQQQTGRLVVVPHFVIKWYHKQEQHFTNMFHLDLA